MLQETGAPYLNYEVRDLLRENGEVKVFNAVEKSVSAPCVYHRVDFQRVTEQQHEAAVTCLKRYAMLVHPRAPRLTDAWFMDDHLVAIEYKSPARAIGLMENNPMTQGSGMHAGELIESTLELLAALHGCGMVHGIVRTETFGLSRRLRVFLEDTGMDRALVDCFHDRDLDASLLLSANKYAHDVGCWAFSILSLILQTQLIDESLEEKWDDYAYKNAYARFPRQVKKPALEEFFVKALGGLGGSGIYYDNATSALEDWRRQGLRSLVQ